MGKESLKLKLYRKALQKWKNFESVRRITIQRKLVLSNILVIVVPLFLTVAFGFFLLNLYGNRYWDALADMYKKNNGVFSAENLIYAYRDELYKEDWLSSKRKTDPAKDTAYRAKMTKELEKELTAMGYQFSISIDKQLIFHNLTKAEERKIKEYFSDSFNDIGSITLSTGNCSIVKDTFSDYGETCVVTAVSMNDSEKQTFETSYLQKYIVSVVVIFIIFAIAAVILTNLILSRWIGHLILKPLKILKNGTKEIADGNLDFQMDYQKNDEFRDVCDEFDQMRGHLRDSVETRLQYEQYRKELIAGISHDLRTPLTSIKGYVSGLKDGIADTEEKKRRYYDAIQTRAGDMETLVESLSTFAKLENSQYRYSLDPVDMDEFMQQVIYEFKEEAAQKKTSLHYRNLATNVQVELDIQEMRRVFQNLFENSIKYRNRESTSIRITMNNWKNQLEIRIADDGPGVSEQELGHIFTSFFRGDKSRTKPGEGSGLGLAIAKQIVEGHKGSISAYNNHGLTILIKLNLRQQDSGEDSNEKNTDNRR